jgi:hypothetical protein
VSDDAAERALLQHRVDEALREAVDEPSPVFSDYRESAFDLTARLMEAARRGGPAAALDEFDRLRESAAPGRLRRALMEFLVHDPAARGLRIPELGTRAPRKVGRSKPGTRP